MEDDISVPHAAAGSIDNVMEITEPANRLVRDLKVVQLYQHFLWIVSQFQCSLLSACVQVDTSHRTTAHRFGNPEARNHFSHHDSRWILQALCGLRA